MAGLHYFLSLLLVVWSFVWQAKLVLPPFFWVVLGRTGRRWHKTRPIEYGAKQKWRERRKAFVGVSFMKKMTAFARYSPLSCDGQPDVGYPGLQGYCRPPLLFGFCSVLMIIYTPSLAGCCVKVLALGSIPCLRSHPDPVFWIQGHTQRWVLWDSPRKCTRSLGK